MSSNVSTAETGVSDVSLTARGTGTATARTGFDVERQILCRHIRNLERELVRERQRRKQVVDHYERLLADEKNDESDSDGVLSGLV